MPTAANTQYVTLAPSVVSTVTFNPAVQTVNVVNRNGAGEVFFTADGTQPTVGAAGTYLLPAAAGASLRVYTSFINGTGTAINLISTAAATIEVDPSSLSSTAGVSTSGGGAAATLAAPGYFRLEDGTTNNVATVSAFHSSDNQALPANSYGLNTGGVAQLLNAAGNIDRQRETSVDNITTAGVATGTAQLASQFSGTLTTATVASSGATPVVFTPSAMSYPSKGVTRTIQVGTVLQTQDTATANQETLYVVSITATTFSAVAKFTHAATTPFTSFSYNQARDSTLPDGAAPGGVPAGTAYFWNQALNSGAGGLEIERSAAGELDGASGAGTAVAAEYEWNGGGPVLASGLETGAQFDRARSVQAKGMASGAITSTVAGNTSIVFASAAATNLISPGESLRLRGGAVQEVVYVQQTFAPGSSATVPLVYPVVNAGQTTAEWDTYTVNGPGLNGFLAMGVGIEEEALYDPVSGLFYIERAATQDAMQPQNVVAESEVLWNGTGFDRARSNLAVSLLPSAAYATTQTSADQLNVNGHCLHVVLDVTVIGTATATVTINGKDPASGKYYPLLVGAAVSTNSTNVYRVGPALTAVANSVANDWVPRLFQIVVTAGGTGSATYSLGYNLSE